MVWLATGLGAFAAGLLQTVTGFGAATVLMLVLPHFFTMTEAAALSSVICMILAASLALRFRAHFRLWLILPPSVIYAAASILAIRSSAKLEGQKTVIPGIVSKKAPSKTPWWVSPSSPTSPALSTAKTTWSC